MSGSIKYRAEQKPDIRRHSSNIIYSTLVLLLGLTMCSMGMVEGKTSQITVNSWKARAVLSEALDKYYNDLTYIKKQSAN